MSDIDSDLEEIPELSTSPGGQNTSGAGGEDDRRAHHNALERKRRDHIKDSFSSLREVVPTLKGEKASRALILKKGAEYIQKMKTRIAEHQHDILELKRQNGLLETQVKVIEGRVQDPETVQYGQEAFSPSTNASSSRQHETSSDANSYAEAPESKRVKSAPPE